MQGGIKITARNRIHYNKYNGLVCRGGIYAARFSRTGYYDIPGKRHGTVKTVPYKPANNGRFSL